MSLIRFAQLSGKIKPQASSAFIRSKKGLEDRVAKFGGNARAKIPHIHAGPLAISCRPGQQLYPVLPGLLSAVPQAIVAQVNHNLLYLALVEAGRWNVALHSQLNGGGCFVILCVLEILAELFQPSLNVNKFRVRSLAPG